MNMGPPQYVEDAELVQALKKLLEVTYLGLKHGFFKFEVSGEIRNGKRVLAISAGTTHRYTITDGKFLDDTFHRKQRLLRWQR
jgi:hypothetical protein